MSLSAGRMSCFRSFLYSTVSPLTFLNSTRWNCGVISKISAAMPKIPFLPSLEPSNFNKPPSFFFTFNRKRLQMSSNLENMVEADLLDVNRTSFFCSVSSNKPDKSKPEEKEIMSKAFKLKGFPCSFLGFAIGQFSHVSKTSSASRGASSLFSVAVITDLSNPFLNQELSMILAIDILVLGFGSKILDNNRRTSGANHLGNLNSALPIFLYISIRFLS
ncbi:hypothetical protein Ahy_B04g071409 [Arachis hypogaea]|uniref:Uncharacterized protein n=1 Tax=Arachis hypogaea TaxID=3818 RepID=A0A444ZKQ6_ARAHY|nr:hypothetical protein Ahy_B04g071409 [Arachis hypogaea]